MIIKNLKTLAVTPERELVLSLAEHGISSVLPPKVFKDFIQINGDFLLTKNKKYTIKNKRIFVVGAGKASAAMAEAIEEIIGPERITAGVVLSNDTNIQTEKIDIVRADHPIPSEENIVATKRLLALKEKYTIAEDDIVIGLISGGGSAMLTCPVLGITLADKQKMTELLLARGASGYENTTLKAKLSSVKGGGLAEHFSPAQIISLVLSDDNGEATHEMTASGPFSSDPTTPKDALAILKKLDLIYTAPPHIPAFLRSLESTIPVGKEYSHVDQIIVAHNEMILKNITLLAKENDIDVIVEPRMRGEAREVAYQICSDIRNSPVNRPTLFLYGGETKVTLEYAHKKGGRNQEFIVACLQYFHDNPLGGKWCVASMSTDGVDFIQNSAGGVIDNTSLNLAREQGLDVAISSFLKVHKTGRLLEKINSNICIGGPTGTNVGDVVLFYVNPHA